MFAFPLKQVADYPRKLRPQTPTGPVPYAERELNFTASDGIALSATLSLDHQVPAEENLAGIMGALKAGGNRRVQSAVMPLLNHLFQTARTGNTNEYDKTEETIAPVALARIAAFVEHPKDERLTKSRGQGAASKTVRQHGEAMQRRRRGNSEA